MNDTEKVIKFIAENGFSTFSEVQKQTKIEQKKLYDILNACIAVQIISKDKERYKGQYKFLGGEIVANFKICGLAEEIEVKQLEVLEMARVLREFDVE